MKKSLLLVALLFIVSSSFAQYKPEAKSVSTEVQFNPFDQNGKTFKLDGLKVRYFITAKDAVRVKMGLGLKNSKIPEQSMGDITHSSKSTSGDFNLNFGYERHFDVAKRLSVYVGGGLGFNKHFASSQSTFSYDMHKNHRKISNGIATYDAEGNLIYSDRGSWRFDAAVFTGLDFYVYKGLYVGTELGLGLGTTKIGKVTIREEITGGSITEVKETIDQSNRLSTTTFGFFIEPTIRLGWTF